MQQTTNYNLNKFDSTDELESATRLGLNENADTIDTALKGIQDDIDGLDAADVSYDNTVSGLTATDVQAALDEELGKIDILSNYSTTETVIGTWVDGRPIYRKCLNTGALPNNNTMSVNHGISNFDFTTNIYGYIIDSTDNTRMPIPYPATTATSSIGIWVSDTAVRINTGRDRTNCSGVIVLEYTKTTD